MDKIVVRSLRHSEQQRMDRSHAGRFTRFIGAINDMKTIGTGGQVEHGPCELAKGNQVKTFDDQVASSNVCNRLINSGST